MGGSCASFSPFKNWLASIFWYALQNLRMTRFCTTDGHPYQTHLCFVHLHLFFCLFFFLFFPCKLSRSTTFFFLLKKENFTTSFSSRSRRSEPSIFDCQRCQHDQSPFLSSSVYIYVNSGTLYFNQKEKTNKKLSGSHGTLLLISQVNFAVSKGLLYFSKT